jgi:hypothetical protein
VTEQNTAVFGIYSDRLSTANAIETLQTEGFRDTDIMAVFPDEIGTWQFATTTRTRLFEGAVAGASAGLLIGGLTLWMLTSMSFSIGTFFMLAILALNGALGSVFGGVAGRRISNYEKRYEGRVRQGDILVSVHCDTSESADHAKQVLQRTGGDDVSVSDTVTVDFVRTHRILVRPRSEKTTAATLRLVAHENRRLDSARLRRNVRRDQDRRGRSREGWGRTS